MTYEPTESELEACEDMSEMVYDAMRFERKDTTPGWVKNGNSEAQEVARDCIDKVMMRIMQHLAMPKN